jgi:DNA repair protein RadA/Sms
MKMLKAALAAAHLGLSVVPVDPATKKSRVQWKELQERIYTDDEIHKLFTDDDAMAFICGAVSGYLECIDFDIERFYHAFEKECRAKGVGELFDLVVKQKTPHGHHIVYRCEDGIDENLKLAWAPSKDGREIAIETRGEGGYFLAAPSTNYKFISDTKWDAIPNITAEERGILLSICVSLSECPYEEHRPHGSVPAAKRPSDKFNETISWEEVLLEHGWTRSKNLAGGRIGWVRPGKEERKGIGATTGNIGSNGDDLLYVHTSNAPKLSAGTCYSKFAAMVQLRFNGDFYAGVQYARESLGLKPRSDAQSQPAYQNTPISRAELYEKRESAWLTLDSVQIKTIDWLFKDRFAKGMLSMIQGDPGEGKSTVARAMVAMITTGQAPAFWGLTENEPRNVVWLTKEESLSHSVAPSLLAMGADLSRVTALAECDEEGKVPPDFLFDDWGIQQLREVIEATEAVAIIIDPLVAFFDTKTDIHKQNETRATLSRLIQMASQCGCVPIGIVHQSKAGQGNPLLKILGSVDFGAACRTAFMVGHDPDDRNKKAFVPTKNNLGRFADPIGFEIAESGEILWDEDCHLDADRLSELASPKAQKQKQDACESWLESELMMAKCEVHALIERAKAQGFSKATLYRAADSIGVSRGNQPTVGRGRGPAWWAQKGYRWENHQWPDPFE